MIRRFAVLSALLLALRVIGAAQEKGELAWDEFGRRLSEQPDGTAEFVERRQFSIRREAVVLRGVARVSRRHGISLEYPAEGRVIILASDGIWMRHRGRDRALPRDPRVTAVPHLLGQLLRGETVALRDAFTLATETDDSGWEYTLTPRAPELQSLLRRVAVAGDQAGLRRIEVDQKERQSIHLEIGARRPGGEFSAEELQQFFRSSP